jgi:hypothetical protein
LDVVKFLDRINGTKRPHVDITYLRKVKTLWDVLPDASASPHIQDMPHRPDQAWKEEHSKEVRCSC